VNSENVGIEEARGRLGDLVVTAQQGTDIILTRRGRPVARITRIQEDTMVTSAESTSTPIANGGYVYNPEVDGPDFADFTATELRELAAERSLDFSAHPAMREPAMQMIYRYDPQHVDGQMMSQDITPDGQIDLGTALRIEMPNATDWKQAELLRTADGRWVWHSTTGIKDRREVWHWIAEDEAREDLSEWGIPFPAATEILPFDRAAALAGYGILTDYTTGEELRAATAEEHARSLAAGETGAYRDEDGRSVFVAGGPES